MSFSVYPQKIIFNIKNCVEEILFEADRAYLMKAAIVDKLDVFIVQQTVLFY